MKILKAIALLILFSAISNAQQVTLRNATLRNATFGHSLLVGTNDIPAELIVDFSGITPTNLLTVASLPAMATGRLQTSLGFFTVNGGTDFAHMQVFKQTNTFPFAFNIEGSLYSGGKSNVLNLLGTATNNMERLTIGFPSNVRNHSFLTYVTLPDIDTGIETTNLDTFSFNVGTSDYQIMQVVLNPGHVPSINVHCSMGGGSTNVQAAALTPGTTYGVSGSVIGNAFTLTVFNPSDKSIVGTATATCNGGPFSTSLLAFWQTGYLVDTTPSQIKTGPWVFAYDDDAVTNFGLWQPATLTNRDYYIGLLGRNRFGDGSSSTAIDDYGQFPLTIASGTWTTGGNTLPALSFNGTTDYATAGTAYNFTSLPFSIHFREHPTSLPSEADVIGRANFNVDGWYIAQNNLGQIVIVTSQFGANQVSATANGALANNATSDVDVVIEANGTPHIYVNAVEQSLAVTATHIAPAASAFPFTVGSRNDGSTQNNFFGGWIQELRLYNSALTTEQVLRIHNRAP